MALEDLFGGAETFATRNSGTDVLELAKAALRSGLIKQEVMDHLASLHPMVPNSTKFKYFVMQLYGEVKDDPQLFANMVQVMVDYKPSASSSAEVSEMQHALLAPEDITRITEFLAKFAYKWRFLGTALKFQPQDLNNIQANNAAASDSVMCDLVALIEEWIQQRHKHTLPPTLGNLRAALNSTIVGLGSLSSELQSIAPVRPHDPSKLPYHVEKLDCIEGKIIPLESRQNATNIRVEENHSLLLEVQLPPEHSSKVDYVWCRNKKVLEESAIYVGTQTPILCISSATLDLDGFKYFCKIGEKGSLNTLSDFTSHNLLFRTPNFVLNVSCYLDKFSLRIASLYLAMPEVPKDTWPPVSSKKYVNLALIRQDQNCSAPYAQSRCTVRGDVDDVLLQKDVIEYDEVFGDLKVGHVVLVEGRPGCGKTTFVHKITRDWANMITREPRGAVRIALLISLRVLNDLRKPSLDLSDILSLFKEDLKVSKAILEECNGKGVCFIFDGLDEFSPPDGKDSLVYTIITKRYLHQSTVIVASRPAATAELRSGANKVIEVLGFRNDQMLVKKFSE